MVDGNNSSREWTFDRFAAGELIGKVVIPPDDELDQNWDELLPMAGDVARRQGLIVALLMRGYMLAMPHRPPGNVHAGLALVWGESWDEKQSIHAEFRCDSASIKRDRMRVEIAAMLTAPDGRKLLDATISMVWAR